MLPMLGCRLLVEGLPAVQGQPPFDAESRLHVATSSETWVRDNTPVFSSIARGAWLLDLCYHVFSVHAGKLYQLDASGASVVEILYSDDWTQRGTPQQPLACIVFALDAADVSWYSTASNLRLPYWKDILAGGIHSSGTRVEFDAEAMQSAIARSRAICILTGSDYIRPAHIVAATRADVWSEYIVSDLFRHMGASRAPLQLDAEEEGFLYTLQLGSAYNCLLLNQNLHSKYSSSKLHIYPLPSPFFDSAARPRPFTQLALNSPVERLQVVSNMLTLREIRRAPKPNGAAVPTDPVSVNTSPHDWAFRTSHPPPFIVFAYAFFTGVLKKCATDAFRAYTRHLQTRATQVLDQVASDAESTLGSGDTDWWPIPTALQEPSPLGAAPIDRARQLEDWRRSASVSASPVPEQQFDNSWRAETVAPVEQAYDSVR